MATFEELISRTITRLSMVPGAGVQTYAESQIGEMIYHKFETARISAWWDDLMVYQELSTDADGVPTNTIVREYTDPNDPKDEILIHSYTDIQHAWETGQKHPLPTTPRRVNPSATVYGKRVEPHAEKVVKFRNGGDGEKFMIRYRQWYPMFLAQDTVPFDEQLLILGACWDYLEDDGTNPAQTEKFKMLYTERMELLISAEGNEAIKLGDL